MNDDDYEDIPAIEVIDGVLTINACCDEANGDWIRAARLRNGSATDKKKLQKQFSTPMLRKKKQPMHDYNLNQPASIKGPFKIVSLNTGSSADFTGWLEDNGRYCKLYVSEFEAAVEPEEMQYRNLDHFAGVLGKFDPYSFCLAEPIEIEELSHASLNNIKKLFPQY